MISADGTRKENPLKLSETHLINQMLKNGYVKVEVTIESCSSPKQWETIFG